MGGLIRSIGLCALLAGLVLAATGTASGLAAQQSGSPSLAAADDGLLETTGETVDDTTDTLDDTTDAVTGGLSDTTGSIDGTTGDTTDVVVGAVNDTTDAVTDTVDGTTDTVLDPDGTGTLGEIDGAEDSTAADGARDLLTRPDREDSPAYRLVAALARNGQQSSGLLVASGGLTSAVDGTAVSDLVDRDGGTDGDPVGAAPSAETAAPGQALVDDADDAVVGPAAAPSGSPLPDAPPEGVASGTLVGAVAAGAVIRQGMAASGTAGAAASTVTTTATAATGEGMDRLVRLIAPFRYSRFDDSDPLDHDVRGRLFEVVEDSPGVYLSEVSERTGVPVSTARHHVRVLEREGLVASAKVRGRRRFYPETDDDPALSAALNDEPTAGLLDALARVGPASVSELAAELDRDPSTVTHHLTRLEEDGIVVRERDGRAIRNRLSPAAAVALDARTEDDRPLEAPASAD